MYLKKKVLVTGGAGFIGSHLVNQLVAHGALVTVLDNLSTGSKENLREVEKNIRFLHNDIRSLSACLQATPQQDIIFHLAADISVTRSLHDPTHCYETNVIGTNNILNAAKQSNVQKFIFSSSAAVYGDKSEPCREDMLCQPLSAYGHSKLIGELLCKQMASNQLHVTCLRYFNVYGPGQQAQENYCAVITAFKNALAQGKPLTIFGDGLQKRDFVAVNEVVKANMFFGCIESDKNFKIINVGSGIPITIKEVAEEFCGSNPNASITYTPAQPGEIRFSCADMSGYTTLFQKHKSILQHFHLFTPKKLFVLLTLYQYLT